MSEKIDYVVSVSKIAKVIAERKFSELMNGAMIPRGEVSAAELINIIFDGKEKADIEFDIEALTDMFYDEEIAKQSKKK